MALTRHELTSELAAHREAAGRPLRLRVVDPAVAHLTTLLAPGRSARWVAPGGALHLLARGPLADAHAPVAPIPPVLAEGDVLVLETLSGPLALTPANALLRVLTAIDTASTTDAGLAALLRQLAHDVLPPAVLGLFGAYGVRGQSPAAIAVGETSGATMHADVPLAEVELRLKASGLNLPLRMRGSARALSGVFQRAAWRPGRTAGPELPATWRWRAPVDVGCTRLPAATVRALGVGDTILIVSPVFDASGHGTLRLGGRLAAGALVLGNRSTWRFTYWADAAATRPEPVRGDCLENSLLPQKTLRTAMDLDLDISDLESHGWHDTEFSSDDAVVVDNATTAAQASPRGTADVLDASLDALPVHLRFEVGELVLSLSALRELAPGAVIPIDGALAPEVRVLCDGGLLGRGELVELDGRLAVALTQWGGRH